MQEAKIGKTLECLVEGYDDESLMYFGRTAGDAPEVDNTIYFVAEDELTIGTFVPVTVLNAEAEELVGQAVLEGISQ